MFASLQGSLNDDDLEKELSAAKDMYNDLQSRFASHTASVIALSSAADARQRQLSAACGVGTEVMQQQVLDRLIASLKAKLALKRKPLDRGKSGRRFQKLFAGGVGDVLEQVQEERAAAAAAQQVRTPPCILL